MGRIWFIVPALFLMQGGLASAADSVDAAAQYKDLATCLSSPATAGKTIIVNCPMAVATQKVSGNRNIRFVDAGRIVVVTGHTLTFAENSGVEGAKRNVFGGVGNVVGLAQAEPEMFGAVANDSEDDGPAIQKALNAAKKVKLSGGTYLCTTVYLNSNNELYGQGAHTVLRAYDATTNSKYILATYAFADGTSDTKDNKRNIYVHDLKLDGQVQKFGYQPFVANMTANATSDLVVERVIFYAFRGDGFYLGSGTKRGLERHNERITIKDCEFDGAVKTNRNGLSVIDCDQLLVENSRFKNIGHPKLSSSVGGIDFEPDANYNVYRNVRIVRCSFDDIDQVNTAGITFFNGRQDKDGRNIRDCVVERCTFTRCYRAINSSTKSKSPQSVTDNFTITGCSFTNSIMEDIKAGGFNGLTIVNNRFEVRPAGSTYYRGGIIVGDKSLSAINAINYKIIGNSFTGLRPQFGAIAIRAARDLQIERNTFTDIAGVCINIMTAEAAGPGRYLEGIRLLGNTLEGKERASEARRKTIFLTIAGAGYEFDSAAKIVNEKAQRRSLAQTMMREAVTVGAPTSGTWAVGSVTAARGGGVYICVSSGTFGALTGVTADVTSGSNAFLNVSDRSRVLREGEYIQISDTPDTYQIKSISGGTVYLTTNFSGPSGTGVPLFYAPPSFIYMAS